ncbi:MAG: ATP-binding cassette domain-containing protein [Syntrophaceae bacterium]|nr:ATP-binding cassette domain-containing protein [Syntrophaceae bacterium]
MEHTSREPVIVVEHLLAAYGENVILRDVSFRVTRGELLAIVGGSGCGKSTLLKYMIGLYRTRQGRVEINGVDIMSVSEESLNRQRLGIGVLFQSDALIGSMTLAENISLPLKEHTDLEPEFISRIVKMKLGMVHLAGYENHHPSELSGGMKKRAGFARAMAMDPTILFFDEPSAGLDPVTAAELYELIQRMNRDMRATIIIVTHDLNLVFAVADRVIMLDGEEQGIIAEGSPLALRECEDDHRVYDFFNRRKTRHP